MEEKVYRAYVTDALKVGCENGTHHFVQGHGMQDYGAVLGKRWIELFQPPEPKDERPCVEIAADTWKRMRGDGK